ncbi:hypothetical protein DEB41_09845 [Vibrio anguillarum]|uniref:Uncharacterized protein n=1 Tax=Vibrio anguillarum TaxID=55601 RepID=A0A3M7LL58_VIBAN|nr:hypothetical protein DD760_13490 [Vibrio anguillarum]MDF9389891.1 hypothetical protein [Vibrio sp. 1151_11]MDQ2194374.1 hypothetical protein [Vibrio sp. A14(2019)]MDQ2195456.1 hypothetical protein [Vibrio sp. 2017_1457_11]NAW89056.1 hypothetical protein [Vibrio sp. V24_P1S3T111]NAW99228.1 hypothetical protein [Vibrio sp. V23_P3S9T160]NAX18001.1 hypothetical protein [Vibrio sp. V22_P2S10T140]NAX45339.1 hypothetical protein [Vibrio sp. V25_P4S6T154]NNN47285.1 hypothetical protein [Vibrio s
MTLHQLNWLSVGVALTLFLIL